MTNVEVADLKPDSFFKEDLKLTNCSSLHPLHVRLQQKCLKV